MPSVNLAMERSLRGSALDFLAAALQPALEGRDLITDAQGKVSDVKTAFSSWDNCMQAAFCKWPVIALIVIGGLIIFSVIYCISRCLCCGLSCCCECCYCLKCCGDCCGCCDPPRGRKHKYLDEPYIPPNQGYRSEAPMTAGAIAPPRAKAPVAEPPQYAEFDVSKKGGAHEDALPEMPSWDGAGSKKVLLEGEAVELEPLKKPENSGQNVPLMTGASATPGPASPIGHENRSPYGIPASHSGGSGYLSAGAIPTADPYATPSQGYDQAVGAYGQSQTSLATDHSYGMAAGAAGAMGPGRRSPRALGNGAYGQVPPNQRSPPPQDYNGYGPSGPAGQGMSQGYGMGPGQGRRPPPRGPGPNMMGGSGYPERARQSPAPQGDYGYGGNYSDRRSPAPQGDYAAGRNYNGRPYPAAPQRQYSSDNNRPYPPGPPQREYSSDSVRPLARPVPEREYSDEPPPSSPLQNTGGFDFSSGVSRPQAYENNSYSRRPGDGRQGGQSAQGGQGGAGAYPGYKAYQPTPDNARQQDGWSGL